MLSILFLSHTPLSSEFRVGSHHLSQALGAMGHRVAHVATPFSAVHRIARKGQLARSEEASRGAYTVGHVEQYIPTPLLPANLVWTRSQTRRMLGRLNIGRPDFVFIDQPLFRPEHFDGSAVVFRPTDLFHPGQMTTRALDVAGQSLGIAATSPGVLSAYRDACPGEGVVIENGVDFSRFRAAALEHPVAKEYDFVYVGSLDNRFSFGLLADAARRLPTASFAIFGPVPALVPELPSNVQLRGPLPYTSVPSALARGRWGIMPFTDTPLNASRSPMKLYEYVAAGLPVVAPQATIARAAQLRSGYGYSPHTSSGFAEVLAGLFEAGQHGVTDADVALAAQMDWSSVAQRLLSFAERVGATRRDSSLTTEL